MNASGIDFFTSAFEGTADIANLPRSGAGLDGAQNDPEGLRSWISFSFQAAADVPKIRTDEIDPKQPLAIRLACIFAGGPD